MTTHTSLLALVGLALALAACGNDDAKVDLGDGSPGVTAQNLAAYEGSWDGYVEAYKFASGSDRVRVTLDAEGHGTIEFGDIPTLPPFDDLDLGYPEDWPYSEAFFSNSVHSAANEGFGYPVENATITNGRLGFEFWGTDLEKDWCEAHAPMAFDQGTSVPFYTCNPNGQSLTSDESGNCISSSGPDPYRPYNCGVVKTCAFACTCDATHCTALRRDQAKMQLDGALSNDGDSLVGTLVILPAEGGWETERVTIRLTR